ncbi:hypothetical protein C7974DRAFT_377748 [Boeremia exigua]|uniref:uncharacterized protein n=1 Tax=Boeremia exigua TaxID=749465 RepID=UPI001E8CAFAD|nr:uncharacterized protein C7974DRAFT_377748 [Boeremia exigua]KAH6622142.1 hypothetical protein C7974DRAFT_377748 [Boeremia exigua]
MACAAHTLCQTVGSNASYLDYVPTTQPLDHAGSNDPIKHPEHQHTDSLPPTNVTMKSFRSSDDISSLHANEARVELDHFARGSSLPANEEWTEQPLLNYGEIEMNEAPQHPHPNILLPDIEAQATERQDPSDTRRTVIASPAVQSKEHFPTVLSRIEIKCKQFSHYMSRVGSKSWTVEICSYFIAILALAGLVATLSAHQSKPLPQWPQLVTINSIISLLSLIMRACVGIVLAEGISQCKWNWYRKQKKLDHIERLDSASRGSWGSFTLLFYFRLRQAYYFCEDITTQIHIVNETEVESSNPYTQVFLGLDYGQD